MVTRSVDTKKIEKAAVLAVKNLIQQCDTIDEKLDVDDKNVLIDGTLELYRTTKFSNANLIGKINVQIKGCAKKFTGKVKYPIEIQSLKKYHEVFHGVLFFYVSCADLNNVVSNDGIYYAQLLPYDIEKLVSTKPKQKTVSITLKPFPKNPTEISRLLYAFHADAERQLKSDIKIFDFFDDNCTLQNKYRSFHIPLIQMPGEPLPSLNSLRTGAYVYGESTEGALSVCAKLDNVCSIANEVSVQFRAGNYKLEAKAFVGQCEEGNFLEFEGIRLLGNANNPKIDYTSRGSFWSRYVSARLLRETIEAGALYINEKRLLSIQKNKVPSETIDILDKRINECEQVLTTFNTLGIEATWDPSKMTDGELFDLNSIYKLLVQKQPLVDFKSDSLLVHFDIQNSSIFAFAINQEDGSCLFEDLFSERLRFSFVNDRDDTGRPTSLTDPVPTLVALSEEGFRKIVNLKPEKFRRDFDRFPITPSTDNLLNIKLLNMLTAYDKGCRRPKALLECALTLAEKLIMFEPDSEINKINLLQTIRRDREFEKQERKTLYDIALDSSSMEIKAAAYALLGNKDEASVCLDRCTEESRSEMKEYPISRFF